MDEYSKLAKEQEHIDWVKKAQVQASYMNDAVRKINRVIAFENKNLEQEQDKKKRANIEMGLYQYKAFNQIVLSQLEKLIKTIVALPNTAIAEEQIEEAIQTADRAIMSSPDLPYAMICIGRFGELILDGKQVAMEELRILNKPIAQTRDCLIHARGARCEPRATGNCSRRDQDSDGESFSY